MERRGRQLQRARRGGAELDWPAINRALRRSARPRAQRLHDADRAARLDRRVLRRPRRARHRADRPVPRHLGLHLARLFPASAPIADEVGSSTMPHKVNPIDFENAEGNLGLANALLRHFLQTSCRSRAGSAISPTRRCCAIWASALGHALIGWQSLAARPRPMSISIARSSRDLDANWERARRSRSRPSCDVSGVENAYEQLKSLTRGQRVTAASLRQFVSELPDSPTRRRGRYHRDAVTGDLHRPRRVPRAGTYDVPGCV